MPFYSTDWFRALIAVAVGLAYFTLMIGVSQAIAAANAELTPFVPWFPLPTLLLIVAVTRRVAARWPIRLQVSKRERQAPLYGFALLATLAAMCLAVLEGAANGLVRTAPTWNSGVSPTFDWAFLFTLPLVASVLAEVGFRGIMQTALEKVMPLWPMLLLLAVLNALFHFYDPDQSSQWLRFISLNLVFGYITWYAQSIGPALVAHISMNFVEPVLEFVYGPIALGEITASGLISVGALGCVSFIAAILLLRRSGKVP